MVQLTNLREDLASLPNMDFNWFPCNNWICTYLTWILLIYFHLLCLLNMDPNCSSLISFNTFFNEMACIVILAFGNMHSPINLIWNRMKYQHINWIIKNFNTYLSNIYLMKFNIMKCQWFKPHILSLGKWIVVSLFLYF
jgi:hypothetical protein